MRALVSYLADEFDAREKSLLEATVPNRSSQQSSVVSFEFDAFFDTVLEWKPCPHPESEGWYCLPLHRPDLPVAGSEYVAFTDHPLRGRCVVLADPEDTEEAIAVSPTEFATLEAASRLRFWHPDCFVDGIEAADQFVDQILATELESQTALTERMDTLETGIEAMDYAVIASEDAVGVQTVSREETRETLREELHRLRETRRSDRIETAVAEAREHLETGDERFDAGEYEQARASYGNGIEVIERLRTELDVDPSAEFEVDGMYQRLQKNRSAARTARQRREFDEIREKAAPVQEQAREAAERGERKRAIGAYRRVRNTLERAREAAEFDPRLEDAVETELTAIRDRIEEIETDLARDQIEQEMEEARRRKRSGDEYLEDDAYADAEENFTRALVHATTAADIAARAGVLTAESETLRDTIETRRTDASITVEREAIEAELRTADRLVEDASQALEDEDPVSAFRSLQQARSEYESVRDTLADRQMGEFDTRIKAQLALVERHTQTAERLCDDAVTEALDDAKSAIETAKEYRDEGQFEAAQDELRRTLEQYQEAYSIASALDSGHLSQIRDQFRRTESEIKAIRSVPAKEALRDCLDAARDCLDAGDSAYDDEHETSAREAYTDALYFINEALEIIDSYDFGTTAEIEAHNASILRQNRRVVEQRRARTRDDHESGRGADTTLRTLTEHFQPPGSSSRTDGVVGPDSEQKPTETPSPATGIEIEDQGILAEIESAFDEIDESG